MGADVAASPHCPLADGHQAWEARQSARAVSEEAVRAGAWASLPGVRPAPRGAFRFAPRAPRRGRSPERFAARQVRRTFRFRPCRPRRLRAETLRRRGRQVPSAEASGLPGSLSNRGCERPPCSQLPFPCGSGPARRSAKPKLSLSPVAARRLASRFCRTGRKTCVLGLPWWSPKARRLPETWALHEACRIPHPLKGKPATSAWRRLRQPPGPSLPRILPSRRMNEPRFARAVAGKASDRCRSIVSATDALLTQRIDSPKRIPPVDNEDNGEK